MKKIKSFPFGAIENRDGLEFCINQRPFDNLYFVRKGTGGITKGIWGIQTIEAHSVRISPLSDALMNDYDDEIAVFLNDVNIPPNGYSDDFLFHDREDAEAYVQVMCGKGVSYGF